MKIFVIVIAAILLGFGYMYVAARFGRRYYLVGPLCVALGVALLTLVVGDSVVDWVMDSAKGDNDWSSNGFVRGALVCSSSFVVGYWCWIIYRSRFPD